MESLAIIGTGIAGMACAYYLRNEYNITLYEKNEYVGGHTNTVYADEGDRQVPIDTGFMVYNEVTYPNLVKLFAELDVKTKPTPMSFSVQHLPSGIEYAGSNLDQLFAQRRNLVRASHWKMIRDILNFNKISEELLGDSQHDNDTLFEYVKAKGLSDAFLDRYLLPMSAAIWSTPPEKMRSFPAKALVRFFKNHGLLGHKTHFQWRTVVDGSQHYRQKLISSFQDRILTRCGAERIEQTEKSILVKDTRGNTIAYDKVIVATHGDEALSLLENPTDLQERLLSNFKYQKNDVKLHTDPTPMPKSKRAWASWNYRFQGDRAQVTNASTVYWMNSLQGVSDRKDYFVSVDDPGLIDESKIIKRFNYTHPIFDIDAIRAQDALPKLNQNEQIFFCGSYFKNGFHEDALTAAIAVVDQLKASPVLG